MLPIHEQEKTLTADEFWELMQQPEYQGRRFELVEGELREMAGGTGGDHGEVTHQAGRLIGNFVAEHKLGRMTAAETCYTLFKNPDPRGKDTVRCPDVGFVSIARAPKPLAPGYVPFAPDLAVEVVSPGNEANEIHNKVLDYLRYGTQLIWVIYPDSQTIVEHTSHGSRILMLEDTLTGGAVLPGFSIPVKDIFPTE